MLVTHKLHSWDLLLELCYLHRPIPHSHLSNFLFLSIPLAPLSPSYVNGPQVFCVKSVCEFFYKISFPILMVFSVRAFIFFLFRWSGQSFKIFTVSFLFFPFSVKVCFPLLEFPDLWSPRGPLLKVDSHVSGNSNNSNYLCLHCGEKIAILQVFSVNYYFFCCFYLDHFVHLVTCLMVHYRGFRIRYLLLSRAISLTQILKECF